VGILGDLGLLRICHPNVTVRVAAKALRFGEASTEAAFKLACGFTSRVGAPSMTTTL
jgi:hypothetical protein